MRKTIALALAGLVLASNGHSLLAQGRNSGPSDAEIKFKVPKEPAYSPQEAMKRFKLDDRFEIQLAAAEPMVEEPVAISFDEFGRLYVVEMRGFMHDVTRKGEDQPIGRIKLLSDEDGDGIFEKCTIFVDGLVMPRAVTPVAGGALIAEPPNLTHYRDINGDGVADEKTVIFTDYGRKGGAHEHMPNEPLWAMDNWLYNAKHTKRFRYEKGKWISATTPLRGQWGIAQDDWGRLFYNYNPELLRAELIPAHYLSRNPNFSAGIGFNYQVVSDQTVHPIHATPGVNRGYQPGVLRDDGTLRAVTAACSPLIYRAELFPPGFNGNAFVCEPAGNLIKRLVLSEERGVIRAEHADAMNEFLASTDERFRPVDLAVGPDGALYVADLYRGVLQHGLYLTHYLIKNIKDRELETPLHRGRIYRIVPKETMTRPARLPSDSRELVQSLAHSNGFIRDTAQRLLIERRDPVTFLTLHRLARTGATPVSRVHALWTLEGLGQLEQDLALKALEDPDPRVQVAAIRLCEPFLIPANLPMMMPGLLELASKQNGPEVELQLALTLAPIQTQEAENHVRGIVLRHAASPLFRSAAISGLRGRELEFIEELIDNDALPMLTDLAVAVMNERRAGRVDRLFTLVEKCRDDARQAILMGMAGGAPAPRGGGGGGGGGGGRLAGLRPQRLIYLDEQPRVLATLLHDEKTRAVAERVSARLAWPGKPGVAPPPVVVPLNRAQQELFEKGRTVYANTCSACHQPNGVGQDGVAPPLVDSEWVMGSPQRLAAIVLHGVAGPISVSGVEYRLEMPGIVSLTDEEVAAVLTYIRREWEHSADPVDQSVVQRVRASHPDRPGMWTSEELLKLE